MAQYTVIGLRDNDSDELHVAAVLEGELFTVDTESESGGMQRWASTFTAPDPDEAELLAHAAIAAENKDDEDDDQVVAEGRPA